MATTQSTPLSPMTPYGRQTSINDPSAGIRTKTYDNAGNIASETDAGGKTVSTTYNAYGQPLTRDYGNELTVNYSYNLYQQLTSMTDSEGKSKSWTYDKHHQLTSENVDGFTKSFAYQGGNVSKISYTNSAGKICDEYRTYTNGTLTDVSLGAGRSIWSLTAEDTRGRPAEVQTGPLSHWYTYDSADRVTHRYVEDSDTYSPQDLLYVYDNETGNVTRRHYLNYAFGREDFDYDALNRLTQRAIPGGVEYDYGYDSKGNITSMPGVGELDYDTTLPYAVSGFVPTAATTMVPMREQTLAYNAMQRVDSISENGCVARFKYYGDLSRSRMTVSDSLGGKSWDYRYFDGSYNEFVTTNNGTTVTRRLLYLGGTPYDAPAVLIKKNSGAWKLHYILRDNLGSITCVTDSLGNEVQQMRYDPWGNIVNVATGRPYAPDQAPEPLLGRGFTGHEHLPWFGLINMNARLYDPALGRFLNPDPHIQAPDNTQNFNRYSYCLNNPLKYADFNGKQTTDNYFLYTGSSDKTPGDLKGFNPPYGSVVLNNVVVTGFTITLPKWDEYSMWYWFSDFTKTRNEETTFSFDNNILMGGGGGNGNVNVSSVLHNTSKVPTETVKIGLDGLTNERLNRSQFTDVKSKDYAKAFGEGDLYAKMGKGLVAIGRVNSIIDLSITTIDCYEDITQKRYWSALARAAVFFATASIATRGTPGAIASVVLSFADAFAGEYLYDYVAESYDYP